MEKQRERKSTEKKKKKRKKCPLKRGHLHLALTWISGDPITSGMLQVQELVHLGRNELMAITTFREGLGHKWPHCFSSVYAMCPGPY